jgi:S1-C subfamily serine protease
VTGVSPCQMRITFENGERCEARLLYTDAWHDFAFIRLNLNEVEWELVEAKLGASFDLKEQDECCMIGNNDSEEYSIKFGVVTNLVINRGEFHSHAFQTSFDRTGGSSGSPIFDLSGRVTGLHMRGTDTTSIELRIEYIKDALEQIQKSGAQHFRRGMIGVELDLVRVSSVVKHCSFPKELVEELRLKWPEIKHVLTVERIVPHGKCSEILRPSDVIHKINGTLIGNNLYLFDKLVDERTGSSVDLVVFRNGVEMSFQVEVEDVESKKIRKFALFAGGVFHDLVPALRSRFCISGEGIFLTQVSKGSSLSELGGGSNKHPTSYVVILEEFCGHKTHSLEEFIDAVKKIGDKKDIYTLSRNHRSFSSALLATYISLDLKFEPLRIFIWDLDRLEWMEQGVLDGASTSLNIVNPVSSATSESEYDIASDEDESVSE